MKMSNSIGMMISFRRYSHRKRVVPGTAPMKTTMHQMSHQGYVM
jgi:hypothetical protein